MILNRRAFTLLELIVVIVVLAVLASLAIPTYGRVVVRSQNETALSTLRAIARDAQALHAYGDTDWDIAVTTAASETRYAALGLTAAGGQYTARAAAGAEPMMGEVLYAPPSAGTTLALRSASSYTCLLGVTSSAVGAGLCQDPNTVATENGTVLSDGADDPLVLPPGAGAGSTGSGQVVAPPSAPVLRLSTSPSGITAAWDPSARASEYKLVSGGTELYSGSSLGFTHAFAVAPGVRYSYELTAYSTGGSSRTTLGVTSLNAPDGVSAVAGNGQATVSFNVVNGHTYRVSGNGQSVSGTTSPLVLTGLTPGTLTTVSVLSTIDGSTSPSSSTTVTAYGPPSAPTGVMATPGDGSFSVSFSASTSPGSTIARYEVRNAADNTVLASSSTSPITVNGVANGAAAAFYVVAVNASAVYSDPSATIAVTPHAAPSTPTNFTSAINGSNVTLSWNAVADTSARPLSGYRLYRGMGASATAAEANIPTDSADAYELVGKSSVTYADTALSANYYCYALAAYGPGGPSNRTSPTCVNVVSKPNAMAAPVAVAGATSATVRFTPPVDNGATITGYQIVRTPGGTVTNAPATATSTNITGLTAGTSYTFTVRAVASSVSGDLSVPSNSVTPTSGTVTISGPSARTGTPINLTIPEDGNYRIDVYGAQGGDVYGYNGGLGALRSGVVRLNAGDKVSVIVGRQGGANSKNSAGGGGTFVYMTTSQDLLAAGGGGGGTANYSSYGQVSGGAGVISTSGTAGANGGNGGVAGNGGTGGGTSGGGAGAGWQTAAGGVRWGSASVGQAQAARPSSGNASGGDTLSHVDLNGGYGGGGAAHGNSCVGGGGGGGYSGGGGGGAVCQPGGGGGSFFTSNSAYAPQSLLSQSASGVNTGDGKYSITKIS